MSLVVWQAPLEGSSPNRAGQELPDPGAQWWLGSDAPARLRREVAAGVVALMFGPNRVGGLSANADGGQFFRLADRYYRTGV